jgi:hypothetical protein
MERLKLAIADKILEATAQEDETMKQNLSRIQRFRDFAEACKSLMVKYPEIEDELVEMVRVNDFDTARASRRVDFIIHKSTLSASSPHPSFLQAEAENIVHSVDPDLLSENAGDLDLKKNTEEQKDSLFLSENDDGNHSSDHAGYVDADGEIVYATLSEEVAAEDSKLKKQKYQKIFSIVWKTSAVILVLILIYLIVKFVVNYWKYILTVVIVFAVLFAWWVYYKKKRNK